jgi:hypothetical protein
MLGLGKPYKTTGDAIRDLADELAPLEFTLSMVYLYACFSLRSPDEVTDDERKTWPALADDLRASSRRGRPCAASRPRPSTSPA